MINLYLFFLGVSCKSTTSIRLNQDQPDQKQQIDIQSETSIQNQTIALYIGG